MSNSFSSIFLSNFFLFNFSSKCFFSANYFRSVKEGNLGRVHPFFPIRACEIPRSVSKTVNNFLHYGLHLRPKKSNTYNGDDVRTMCCFFLGRKACMKKFVYSFWYRLSSGQVGREVFHIVLNVLEVQISSSYSH